MKKIICIFTTTLLCFNLLACGSDESKKIKALQLENDELQQQVQDKKLIEELEQENHELKEQLWEKNSEEPLGDNAAYLGGGKYRFRNIIFQIPDGVEFDDMSTLLYEYESLFFEYGDRRLSVQSTADNPKENDDMVKKSLEEWAVEAHYDDNDFEILESRVLQIAGVDAMIEEYRYILSGDCTWIRKITLRPESTLDSICFGTSAGGTVEDEDLWKVINDVVDSIVVLENP